MQLNGDLIEWLESRAIDRHRVNSRLLKRLLRLTTAEDAEVAMHVNASTVIDTYWVCEDSEPTLTYGNFRNCNGFKILKYLLIAFNDFIKCLLSVFDFCVKIIQIGIFFIVFKIMIRGHDNFIIEFITYIFIGHRGTG